MIRRVQPSFLVRINLSTTALLLSAATLRAKVTEKWASEITWITADRIRFGQPLGSASLRFAGMARIEASGWGRTGGCGKLHNESELATIG